MKVKTISEDDRPIKSVHNCNEKVTLHVVGSNGITRIEPYLEAGEYSNITYLAIFKGGDICERIPALPLTINY